MNDLLFFIKQTNIYNYAGDNTLACFAASLLELFRVLTEEAGNAFSWLDRNETIANPKKFHALFVK